MGFRFRKSVNLGGGFRVNLSKSGVGYSWGVPGYRVTKTSKGRTRKTYSVPGTGLSYVEESGNKNNRKQSNPNYSSAPGTPIMEDIVSADIESYQSAEYQDFISSIKKIIVLNKIANWLCLTLLFASEMMFLFTGIIGLLLKVYIRSKGKIDLDYELDDYYLDKHSNMISAWTTLSNSSSLWQIIQSGNVTNRKFHAGASRLVNRKLITVTSKKPFYLKTSTDIIQLKLTKETLIFMPDKIVIVKGTKIGALNYKDIHIESGDTIFIEEEKVPKDATIIDYTWSKVNKDGSPDRRFKDNKQIPRCNYGAIGISSQSGLNIRLHCSNLSNTVRFGQLI